MVAQEIQPADRTADIRFLQAYRAAVNDYLHGTGIGPASTYQFDEALRKLRLGSTRYWQLRQAINQGKARAHTLLAEAGCRPMIIDPNSPPSEPVILPMLDLLLNNLLTIPLPPSAFLDPLDEAIGWLQWRHAQAVMQMGILQRETSSTVQQPTEQFDATEWALEILDALARSFPDVVAQLAQRHDNRPPFEVRDEYDVQDLFHALFQIYFNEIQPEEPTPTYAGSSTRIDFMLAEEGVMIEIKMTRPGLGQKGIKEQLLIDIPQYRRHPNCKAIVAIIYDPDKHIRNAASLESGMSHDWDGTPVAVYVVR